MNAITRLPAVAPSRPRELPFEYTFTIFAVAAVAGSLNPIFYDLTVGRADAHTEVNPLRMLATTAIYLAAAALVLYRKPVSERILLANIMVIVVALLPLVSILWSVDPGTTLRRSVAHLLTVGFCVYLCTSLTPEEFLRRLTLTFFIGGIASFIYVAVAPHYAIHFGGGNDGSWKGVFGHKNQLGRIAVIAIVAALYTEPLNGRQRLMSRATIALYTVLVVFSQSRTNWLTLIALFGVVPLARFVGWSKISEPLRVAAFLVALATALFAVTIGAEMALEALGRDATFSGRTTLWEGVRTVLNDNYPVLGAGYGAFFTEKGAVYALDPYLSHWHGIPNHAHSGYLDTRANLGYPGQIVLFVILAALTWRLLRKLMFDTTRRVWTAFVAIEFIFLVNNFSETVAFQSTDILWVIMICMLIYSRSRTFKPHSPVPVVRRTARAQQVRQEPT